MKIHSGWMTPTQPKQPKQQPQPERTGRICIECEREFVSPYPRQTMCTKYCRDQRALRRAREQREAAKPQSVPWLPSIDLQSAKEDMPQWLQPNIHQERRKIKAMLEAADQKQKHDGIGKAQVAEVKRAFRETRGLA